MKEKCETASMAENSRAQRLSALLRQAAVFTCSLHDDKPIKGFSLNESAFCCVDCLKEKPGHTNIKLINSADEAKEVVEETFRRSFCARHPEKEATHFCFTDGIPSCWDCASTFCTPNRHKILDLNRLYNNKIDEIEKITDSLTQYREVLKPETKHLMHEFRDMEMARINAAFDDYINLIETKRQETIQTLEKRVKHHFKLSKHFKQDHIDDWQHLKQELLAYDKSTLVMTSFSDHYQETSHKIKKSLEKAEKKHAELKEKSFFDTQSYFLGEQFVDLSEISFVSDELVPRMQKYRQVFTEISALQEEIISLCNSIKNFNDEKEMFIKRNYDNFRDSIRAIKDGYCTGQLEMPVVKKLITESCNTASAILESYSWQEESGNFTVSPSDPIAEKSS